MIGFDCAHCVVAEFWFDVHVRAIHAVFAFNTDPKVAAVLAVIDVVAVGAVLGAFDKIAGAVFGVGDVGVFVDAFLFEFFEHLFGFFEVFVGAHDLVDLGCVFFL